MASETHPSSSRARMKLTVIVCIICGTSASETLDLYKLPCNHHHCSRCLGANFSLVLRAKPFSPARCCGKTLSIDPDILKAAVDPVEVSNHMEAYLAKLEEYNCKDKLYCHVKTCSNFIPVANRSFRVGTCPKCAYKTCKKCKGKSHWGPCPADRLRDLEGDKQLLALAESKQWKQCPDCSTMVERMDGCPHMTCVCGCEFCYNCGRTPFESHRCGPQPLAEV